MPDSLNPVFGIPGAARVIPLRGFSGCRVALIEESGDRYVRKLARDTDYNARLIRQAEKQKAFYRDAVFQPVKVRATGILPSGLTFIDMDYVADVTAAETLPTLSLSRIRNWVEMFLRFTHSKGEGTLPPDLFRSKIAALRGDLENRNLLGGVAAQSLDYLAAREWNAVPRSACHGDLTLENMIMHDGRLYLIDFLDSFADSWYLDIAKLMQDLIGGWSFRHGEIDRNLLLRLASLRHMLETALEAVWPGCTRIIRDLYLLNLLRILPYCSSQDERRFVEGRLAEARNDFP